MADVWLNSYNICKKYISSYRLGLDVGCRRGDWAKHMVKDFNHVIGWDYRNKSAHIRKIKNLDQSKFTFHNQGLGEANYTTYTKSGVGKIKGTGNTKIEIRSIDSYNLEDVDFIKMDVEGYEPKGRGTPLSASARTRFMISPTSLTASISGPKCTVRVL